MISQVCYSTPKIDDICFFISSFGKIKKYAKHLYNYYSCYFKASFTSLHNWRIENISQLSLAEIFYTHLEI